MKKIIWLLVGVACLIWSTRIYQVNQEKREVELYHMGEEIPCGQLIVTATEACLYDSTEFEERFGVATETIHAMETDEEAYRIIGVCLRLENRGDTLITWEEIGGEIGEGFEAVIWRNGIDPYLGSAVSPYEEGGLEPDTTKEIWYMTTVNRRAFKEKSWKNHEEQTFYFVISLYPDKTWIELDVRKEYAK